MQGVPGHAVFAQAQPFNFPGQSYASSELMEMRCRIGSHEVSSIEQHGAVVQGVTTLPTARDVCTWSDIIFLCGSYEDAYNFLRTQGRQKALKGKCVLQLASGTPEEALTASNLAKLAGARYLDAFVFVRSLPP